ncbi:MAG: MmgE/PrpD family protein [Rhizobiales bacterium]|nr:MmgE/PrpD family protein [Hyphomicrobiales bacterium]
MSEIRVPLLADDLVQWAISTVTSPLSALARSRARAAIADVIACMIAGRDEPAVLAVKRSVRNWGEGRSGGNSEPIHLPAPFAALINGTAAHVLDYDDNFFPAISHASAVLVPTLLALGEECNTHLARIIPAYIAGLEVQAILGERMNPEHYELGWHATSTLGTIGAAASAGLLLELPPLQLRHALSLAASLAAGSKKQFGTSAKPIHAGYAAMHGILAAKLAQAGIDAAADVFEGPWGFLTQFTQGRMHTPSALESRTSLHIEKQGLTAKLYPSCMSTHLGIDGVLALRASLDLDPDTIAEIEIAMPRFMIANLRFPVPTSREQARFSMHYCAAVAAIDGAPRLHHFTMPHISRPDLAALATKVRMVPRAPSPETAHLPWGGDAEITVRLTSGEQISTGVAFPKGSHGHPMSEAEQEQKFSDCCANFAQPQHILAFYQAIRKPDDSLPLSAINAFLTGET